MGCNFTWSESDREKFAKVFNTDQPLTNEMINHYYDEGWIIHICDTVQEAYKDFMQDTDYVENFEKHQGFKPTLDWFEIELGLGYGKSGSIEIARLICTTHGIYYDMEYAG